MAYQGNKPGANDRISTSQSDIQNNFTEIQTVLTVNHVDFADPNEGKHTHVSLPEQAADKVTAASEMALYTKDSGTAPNLYLRQESNGTVFNITPSNAGHAASGYETLPSGLKMCWGTSTIASGSSTRTGIAFASAFSTAVYSVQLCCYDAHGAGSNAQDFVVNPYSVALASFAAKRNSGYTGPVAYFYYLAIGV